MEIDRLLSRAISSKQGINGIIKEKLNFNTGYLAKQADGAVAVSYGEIVVFASAVASRDVKEGQDFFPLTVDYREKAYAAGKFPGGRSAVSLSVGG